MSRADKGVLLFSEWFEALDKLSPKDFKTVVMAIYRYQIKGEEPLEFQGKSQIVASIIFPYIKTRIARSKAGKTAAESRREFSGNPIVDELLRRKKDADPDK